MINKNKVRLTLVFIYLVNSVLGASLIFIWSNVAHYRFIAKIAASIDHHFPALEDEFMYHVNYTECLLAKVGKPILESYGYDKDFFLNQNRYRHMVVGILISLVACFVICLYLYGVYKKDKENFKQNKPKIWVWISVGNVVILVTLLSGSLLGGFANYNISTKNYDFLVQFVGSLQENHNEENEQMIKQIMDSFKNKPDSSKGYEILSKSGYALKDFSVNSISTFIKGGILSLLPLTIIFLLLIDEYNE